MTIHRGHFVITYDVSLPKNLVCFLFFSYSQFKEYIHNTLIFHVNVSPYFNFVFLFLVPSTASVF